MPADESSSLLFQQLLYCSRDNSKDRLHHGASYGTSIQRCLQTYGRIYHIWISVDLDLGADRDSVTLISSLEQGVQKVVRMSRGMSETMKLHVRHDFSRTMYMPFAQMSDSKKLLLTGMGKATAIALQIHVHCETIFLSVNLCLKQNISSESGHTCTLEPLFYTMSCTI